MKKNGKLLYPAFLRNYLLLVFLHIFLLISAEMNAARGGPLLSENPKTDGAFTHVFEDWYGVFCPVDTVAPVALCKNININLDGVGTTLITAMDVDNGSGDDCGIANMVVSPNEFSCANLGINVVTLTVTDSAGNTGSCTASVIVLENPGPFELLCQSLTTFYLPNQYNYCIAPEEVLVPTPAACGVHYDVTIDTTMGGAPGPWIPACVDSSDLGQIYAVRVIEDANSGNTCYGQVEIHAQLPACTAPPDVVTTCIAFDHSLQSYGIAQVEPNWCLDTTKIFMGQIGLGYYEDHTQFDSLCSKGTLRRVFTVFNCTGDSSQCVQRIVSEYIQNYFVRFPDDVLGGSCDSAGYYGTPEFFGQNCELFGVTYKDVFSTDTTEYCFYTDRKWMVVNYCTYNPNFPLIQIPNPSPGASPNDPANLPGVTVSECGTTGPWAPSVVNIHPGDPAPTNYCSFWSANVNGYEYHQIIRVSDTIAPSLDCPAAITLGLGDSGSAILDPSAIPYSVYDLCTPLSALDITGSVINLDCGDAGTVIPYTLVVSDVCGNTASCTVIVDIVDLYGPFITCPSYIYQNTDTSDCTYLVVGTALDAVAADSCGLLLLSYQTAGQLDTTGTSLAGIVFPTGFSTVTWTAVDVEGNTASCIFFVQIDDNQIPVIESCPSALTVSAVGAGVDSCIIIIPDLLPLLAFSDNCTPQPEITTEQVPEAGSISEVVPGFPQAVTLYVVDNQGNTAYCQVLVTGVDSTPPQFTNCPTAPLVYENLMGTCTGEINWPVPMAEDQCSAFTIVQTEGPEPGSVIPATCPGNAVTISYTATDSNGNTAVCNFSVEVIDVEIPNIQCQPANITLDDFGNATLNPANLNNGTSDNCTSAEDLIFSLSAGIFDCGDIGEHIVLLTVTDNCANTASCTSVVTVLPGNGNCEPQYDVSGSDPCVCLDNATTEQNGQFSETIQIHALAGQVWTVASNSGLFQAGSPAPPILPVPVSIGTALISGTLDGLDNDQDNIIDEADERVYYTFKGRHIDGVGYSAIMSNNTGQQVALSNTCFYPSPYITNLNEVLCVNSAPFALEVKESNNAMGNVIAVLVNGQQTPVVNPAALGVGTHTVTVTFDAGGARPYRIVNGTAIDGTLNDAMADPGCIQSVSQIVNVIATPSQIACNNNVQISLDEDCETEILPDMILEGTYGCFDDYKVELDKTTPLGNGPWVAPIVGVNDINKTYGAKVTHLVSGVSCWGTIKIEDNLAPIIACTTFNIACAETNYDPAYLSGVLGITAAYPSVVENCGTYTQTFTDEWFDLPCPPSPTAGSVTAYIIRTWVVTDASGNSSTCSQTINIIGSRVYDVQFPTDVTISCGANVNTNPAATGTPYITFIYPAVDVDYAIWPGSNYCELQSTYVDQILPVCDGTYKILRTWTVYDWCVPTSPFPPTVNPQYYIQVIKVTDESGPTFACPADMTVSTDPFNCCSTTDLPDIIMSDNCSRINHVSARVLVYDPYTGDLLNTLDMDGWLTTFPGNNLWAPDTLANFGVTPCLPIGRHTVIYTATDDCGNYSTCSFELEVRDLTPPVTACDEWTQVALGINGMAFVNAETFDDGSYDNCGGVFFKARRMAENDCDPNTEFDNQVKFCCSDIGDTILVVLRVYDVDPGTGTVGLEDFEGHYNDCMVQALVEDKIKPVCTAPANVTVSCEAFDPSYWAYGQATATDNCCIDTITGTVVLTQFDSLCNKGTITRRWTAIDCGGNTSQCTQRIIVTYNQHYYVKFPADRLISTCDGTGNYGAPEFYGEDCELLATSFNDEIFTVVPDACFKIERTWTVINWCTYNPNLPCIYVPNPNPSNTTNAPANLAGVTVSECGNTVLNWNPTVVKINPSDPTATNYCTFWSANANCYQYKQIIKVIDTQDPSVVTPTPGEYCDYSTNDAAFWNESYYWDASIASHDLCEGDANIELTATDACSGANISFRYLLFLDLDGDGTMETVVNSVNPPGYNNINYNNANNPNYAGGIPQQFDFRSVPFNQKWGFGLQTDAAVGNNRTARVRWFNQLGQNAVPQLPYGNHKIKWFVEDGCGNEYVYEQPLTVKDCKKPTVVCLNGLSVNLMNTSPAMVQLWASDFLQYTEDNCTPANQLKIAIRRSGTGTGFPTNPDGTPQTGVTFDCNDLGTQLVELWSIDKAGNADFCETYVLIQDNMGVCGTNATVAGALLTEEAEGVQDATVELEGVTNGLPTLNTVFSDVAGNYAFSNALPIGSNYTVTPTMEIDPLNGVNTYDLILISRHILGLEPLNTPYKLISADANKSGTVTTFDVVELRKLILGTYTKLPNNSSWRFVDKTQVFADPNNPFAETIRENVSVAQIQQSAVNDDFVGAKIGDVDNTAIPNQLVAADDRTNGTLLFDIDDREVNAGEVFDITFSADQVVRGYQFTLGLDGLTPALSGGEGVAMSDENFGIFNDAVTTSWDAPAGMTSKAQFTLRFKALKSGKLSDMLKASSRITKAEAYTLTNPLSPGEGRGEALDIALRFNGKGASTVSGVGFELYQNMPNPWINKTTIGFHLPEAATATLNVFDADGRVIYTAKGNFGKGYNTFLLDRKLVDGATNLYYTVSTATDSGSKQMIQVR